jgi:hypothetical protein
MTEAFDPAVQKILDELPGALGEEATADEAAKTAATAVEGIDSREQALRDEHATAVAGVAAEHASRTFGTYAPRLQHLMEHVLGGGEGDTGQTPDLEDCERIFAVDGLISAAAGQPVLVVRPERSWIDIGRLKLPPDPAVSESTGLRLDFHWRTEEPTVVLPVIDTVTIDPATGQQPTTEVQYADEELSRRRKPRMSQFEEARTQPAIDPLHTAVIVPGVGKIGAEASEDGQAVTHILVGYDFLQKALNRVLGFDFDDTEALDAVRNVRLIEQQNERLGAAGVAFDPDFIDGYLAYRIEMLEHDISEAGAHNGPSQAYHEAVLRTMRDKLSTLVEAGWITKPASRQATS